MNYLYISFILSTTLLHTLDARGGETRSPLPLQELATQSLVDTMERSNNYTLPSGGTKDVYEKVLNSLKITTTNYLLVLDQAEKYKLSLEQNTVSNISSCIEHHIMENPNLQEAQAYILLYLKDKQQGRIRFDVVNRITSIEPYYKDNNNTLKNRIHLGWNYALSESKPYFLETVLGNIANSILYLKRLKKLPLSMVNPAQTTQNEAALKDTFKHILVQEYVKKMTTMIENSNNINPKQLNELKRLIKTTEQDLLSQESWPVSWEKGTKALHTFRNNFPRPALITYE